MWLNNIWKLCFGAKLHSTYVIGPYLYTFGMLVEVSSPSRTTRIQSISSHHISFEHFSITPNPHIGLPSCLSPSGFSTKNLSWICFKLQIRHVFPLLVNSQYRISYPKVHLYNNIRCSLCTEWYELSKIRHFKEQTVANPQKIELHWKLTSDHFSKTIRNL
jgi:hypothetical protein